MLQRHVDDEDGRALGKGGPVEPVGNLAGAAVPGDEGDGGIDVAMGRRDTCIGKTADASGYSRDDAERDPAGDQRQRLLGAAAEDIGIAALEAEAAVPGAGELEQAGRDVALLRRGLAAALAGEFERRLGTGEAQDPLVDERVVDDD